MNKETIVKAILWDVDGTLYRPWPLYIRMIGRMFWAYKLHPVRLQKSLKVLWLYQRSQERMRGEPAPIGSPIDRVQLQRTAQITNIPFAFVEACVNEWIVERPLPIMRKYLQPGVKTFLSLADSKGVKLGVVSDYPAQRKLEALGIADYFHVIVSAQDADVNEFKPGRQGFNKALVVLGVAARDAAYIGNSKTDRCAAEAVGIRFVHISQLSGQWEDLLRN